MSSPQEPEVEKKFIEDSLGVTSEAFGEQITHQVWVDANRSPSVSGSAFNKRLIVVGKCKVISIKRGAFGKSVEVDFHLYNVSEICSESEDTFTIKYNGENNEALGISIKGSLDKLQNLILAIRTSYRRITCGFPEESMMKLNLPQNKLIDFELPLVMSAAHGFVDGYIAHSYYYPKVYKTVGTLDFIRNIEALYHNDITELDFTQFAGIEPTSELSFNLFTAITSLRNNTYFKSINLSGLPHANITSAIGMCLETNKSITKLNLSNLRVEQSFQGLANGLVKNPGNVIQALDLSKNNIPYPIMATICECFSKFSHGLVSLNLSKCELLPKTISILFESFERNFGMSLAIKYLNLSHNKFGDIGSQAIGGWMAKIRGHHSLECLVLANCSLNFQLMGPPLRVVDVPRLDLSLNRIDRSSAKLLGSEVFDTVANLLDLNFSGCGLNADSLEEIFISFNRNRKISNVQLNLSHNALGSREATLLSKSISGCRYLTALDISHNRLNCRSLMELLSAIKNIDQFNLHELNMSHNYFAQGPEGDQFCFQLAQLVNNHPTIRTLNICGGRYPLGKSLTPLLEILIKNNTLKELDISENGLGDAMASIVGELLRSNSSLIYINLDNNQFGLSGWTTIAQPLLFDTNRTLNHMVFPKTLASAYTSTLIQNFASTIQSSFGSLTKEKRNQMISLFQKMQDKLAENRFETSVLDSVYVSEYITKQVYNVHIPDDFVTPLVDVPEHLSSLPPSSPSYHDHTNHHSGNGVSAVVQPSISISSSSSINSSSSSVGSVSNGSTSTHNNGSTTNNKSQQQLNGAGSSTPVVAAGGSTSTLNNDRNARSRSNSNSSVASSAVSQSKRSSTASNSTAAPPRQLITQTSDWQPNEESEADIYESSNNSFVAYSTDDESDNYTQDNSEYEKPQRKSKPKSIKSNASVVSVKSTSSVKSAQSVKSASSVKSAKSSTSVKSSKSSSSKKVVQPPPIPQSESEEEEQQHHHESEEEEEQQQEQQEQQPHNEQVFHSDQEEEQVEFQSDEDLDINDIDNNNNNNLNEFHSDSQPEYHSDSQQVL